MAYDVNSDGYYNLDIGRIDVGGTITVGEPGRAVHVKEMTAEEVLEVATKSCGLDVGDSTSPCFLRIEDNGIHGDGVMLSCCMFVEDCRLFSCRIPESSLTILIATLQLIQKLRKNQKESEDE